MIVIVSPAKRLDFETPAPVETESWPAFEKKTKELASVLKSMSAKDLQDLMGLSDKLAELNYERFQKFKFQGEHYKKQAMYAFMGDTYQGLAAHDLTAKQAEYAQDHLRMLSGLYGVLRPFDMISPYRLEMGTKLKNSAGDDLYTFWKKEVTKKINEDLQKTNSKAIVNCASKEYSQVIDFSGLEVPVINPVFKEYKNGKYKTIALLAKRARGMMARYVVGKKLKSPDKIKNFDLDGYKFSDKESTETDLVFLRKR